MRHEEDDLQMQCVTWFRYQYRNYAMLLHHSPNGGRRDAREGARFKQMGVVAGFPDLILCVARGGYHGLFIEMKSRTGRQEQSQKVMQTLLEKEGYKYVLCRSLLEFMNIINNYMQS